VANYSVDIEIGVKGEERLRRLKKEVDLVFQAVDSISQKSLAPGKELQNIQTYNAVLAKTAKQLTLVRAGTIAESDAVRQFVDALGQANGARQRQQDLITQEIAKRRQVITLRQKEAEASLTVARQSGFKEFSAQIPSLISTQKAIRRNQELQEKRLRLSQKQVQTENQVTAAVENQNKARSRGQGFGSSRGGQAISSALIGGGFPLLFGQGGVAAAGGALGGLAGGVLGGGFGFALSIIGTAVGDAITKAEEFDKALVKLNARTSDLGRASTITGRDIEYLSKSLGIAQDDAIELFGAFSEFDRVADKASLAMIFGDDPGAFDRLAAATKEVDLAQEIFANRKRIGNQAASQLLDQLKIGDAASVELALAEARLAVADKQAVKDQQRVRLLDRIAAATFTILLGEGIDPAEFGQKRGEKLQQQQEQTRKARLEAFKKSLEEVRGLRDKVLGFQPTKPDRAAESAAKRAQREREQLERQVTLLGIRKGLTENMLILDRQISEARREGRDEDVNDLERSKILLQGLAREDELRVRIKDTTQLQAEIDLNTLRTRGELEKLNQRVLDQEKVASDAAIKTMQSLDDELALQQAKLAGKGEEVALQQQAVALAADNKNLSYDTILDILKQIEAVKELVNQQELMKAVFEDIGMTIKTGIVDAITAAVEQTQTLAEVASNMLRNIANRLLDVAVNLALFGVPTGIGTKKSGGLLSGIFGKANGGSVSANTPYMVGERGPELFVPGAQGNIVPNNAMGGVQVGSINITVENTGDQLSPAAQKQIANQVQGIVMSTLVNERRSGGVLR